MRLFNLQGKLVNRNVSKYAIRWDGVSKSQLQFRTKQFLKPFWIGCICYEEFPVYGSKMKVDLLNATLKIAIEVNGPQHSSFHWFHGNNPSKYLTGFKLDMKKIEWLKKNEFQVIEINFDEVDLLTQAFFLEKFKLTL
jgi:hypothetical protein